MILLKAVILAAGEGRRCRPLTQTRAKVMLPVGNRPFMEHVILALALNGNPHLQQFRIVFITGIRSGIFSRLDRSAIELIERRAFTSLQLRTILEENHRPLPIGGAQPPALQKGQRYGGPRCSDHEAGIKRCNHPPVRSRIGPAPGSHGRARRPGLLFL